MPGPVSDSYDPPVSNPIAEAFAKWATQQEIDRYHSDHRLLAKAAFWAGNNFAGDRAKALDVENARLENALKEARATIEAQVQVRVNLANELAKARLQGAQ